MRPWKALSLSSHYYFFRSAVWLALSMQTLCWDFHIKWFSDHLAAVSYLFIFFCLCFHPVALPRWHGLTNSGELQNPLCWTKSPNLPRFWGSAATRWSFLLKCSFTIIIVIACLSASVFLSALIVFFQWPGLFHIPFPPDIFLDKSYDRSLLNSFWNGFLIFPPLYLCCVCVCDRERV